MLRRSRAIASRTRARCCKVGETVEAKFTGVDRKTRIISLSIKAKEAHEEAQAMQNYKTRFQARPTSGTTLGDLLKEQMSPE